MRTLHYVHFIEAGNGEEWITGFDTYEEAMTVVDFMSIHLHERHTQENGKVTIDRTLDRIKHFVRCYEYEFGTDGIRTIRHVPESYDTTVELSIDDIKYMLSKIKEENEHY